MNAGGLGQGSGGGQTWNGGILVEIRNDSDDSDDSDSSSINQWIIAMQSDSGNVAKVMQSII